MRSLGNTMVHIKVSHLTILTLALASLAWWASGSHLAAVMVLLAIVVVTMLNELVQSFNGKDRVRIFRFPFPDRKSLVDSFSPSAVRGSDYASELQHLLALAIERRGLDSYSVALAASHSVLTLLINRPHSRRHQHAMIAQIRHLILDITTDELFAKKVQIELTELWNISHSTMVAEPIQVSPQVK